MLKELTYKQDNDMIAKGLESMGMTEERKGPYYTMRVDWDNDGNFEPEYGSYSITDVKEEREDLMHGYHNLTAKQVKITKEEIK